MTSADDFSRKDFYRRLGLARTATLAEIKEAYREIARVYHPDSNHYGEIIEYELSEEDKKVFQLVTAAYDTLIKDDKRAAYDKSLPPELQDFVEGEQERVLKNSGKWESSAEQEAQRKHEEKLRARGQVFDTMQTTTRVTKPGQKMQTFSTIRRPVLKPQPKKTQKQDPLVALKRNLLRGLILVTGATLGALLFFFL